jgi:hypothetical protein
MIFSDEWRFTVNLIDIFTYRENDINVLANLYIRHRLGGFELDDTNNGSKYLLRNIFEDLDGPYRTFYTEAVNEFSFDYHFNKSKQPIPKTDESDSRRSVFDELTPIMLAEENCRAKIVFPFNIAANYWSVGEIILNKQGETITALVLAHDPYGKGEMPNMKFKVFEILFRRAFAQFHVEFSSRISPYTSNRLALSDVVSSGVIVVDELVKRIVDESLTLSAAYQVGAPKLRKCQKKFAAEFCNDSNDVEMDGIEEIKELVLSVKEVSCKLYAIINSKESEKEIVEKLQQIEADFYKPLVTQLAYQNSFEELKDLVIVFNNLITLALTMSDLTNQLEYITEAGVFCQYLQTILKEKFTVEQRNKFLVRYSISPSQQWKEIQEKLISRIGGLSNLANKGEEYGLHVINLRIQARQEFESIEKHLEQLKESSPQYMNEFTDPVRDLFERISANMKSLITQLFHDSELIMTTPPPCRYAIIGLGSLALQQITPYSGFEFAILTELDATENPQIMNYFENLCHLANIKMIGMGESGIPFNKFQLKLDDMVHVGINFDLGSTGNFQNLIKTVPKMLEYVYKQTQSNKNLSYTFENVCYVSGAKELVEAYQQEVTKYLNQTNLLNQKNCGLRALKVLKDGAVEFGLANQHPNLKFDKDSDKVSTGSESKFLDIKQEV